MRDSAFEKPYDQKAWENPKSKNVKNRWFAEYRYQKFSVCVGCGHKTHVRPSTDRQLRCVDCFE